MNATHPRATNPQPPTNPCRPSPIAIPPGLAWLQLCNCHNAIATVRARPRSRACTETWALIGSAAGGQASTPRKCFRSDTAPSNRRTVESSNRCHCEAVANACNVGPESPNPEPLPSHTAHPSCKNPHAMDASPCAKDRNRPELGFGFWFWFGLGFGLGYLRAASRLRPETCILYTRQSWTDTQYICIPPSLPSSPNKTCAICPFSFDAGAKKPIPTTGSRQKTNKPWSSTLNAARRTLQSRVGSPLAGPWIGFRRDSRAAVSAGRRPCNGNQRTKTGTNHRTLAPRQLAHPRRPIASLDGLGGVGGLSIAMAAFWLEPGRSPRDSHELCDSLHSLPQ